ncbi:hypothetical protein MJM04_35120, partial [Salmonella enterica subsp. enterica serovar Cerro]|nr:hypothetical protein [Salmonella enterica subsp. enterica serovar Cerro]
SVTAPGGYAILALRFIFLRHFFALFFANTGKFCTGEHQTGAFIPAGLLSSFIGAPYFIFLLRKQSR